MKVYKSIMIIKNHILEFYRIASFLFTFQVLLVKLIFENFWKQLNLHVPPNLVSDHIP